MNILVLGGSYFLGKQFVNMARTEHSITVFNRGNRPLMLPQVREIVGDRHDIACLESLGDRHYDAVVDFCAYSSNDIRSVFAALKGNFDQYIFISTCDVYMRGLGRMLDEKAVFETRDFGGETGQYILGKVALEMELKACAEEYEIAFTSIRPAFIYGPENYAPRESMYFHWIREAGQMIHPKDATGEFQMVYVEDVARAILAVIGKESAYGEAYNLAPLPMITYDDFADALAGAVTKPFSRVPVSVQTVYEKQIPLPFPLVREESNWYNGTKIQNLIGSYTELTEGLRKTASFDMKEQEV